MGETGRLVVAQLAAVAIALLARSRERKSFCGGNGDYGDGGGGLPPQYAP